MVYSMYNITIAVLAILRVVLYESHLIKNECEFKQIVQFHTQLLEKVQFCV